MRGLWAFALSLLIGQAVAAPLVVHPGNANDIVITLDNTVNGTAKGIAASTSKSTSHDEVLAAASSSSGLALSVVNNFDSPSMNAYVTGIDQNNSVIFVKADGSVFYPPLTTSGTPVKMSADVAIPVGAKGSTTTITLPNYISSGRVWFAAGELTFFTVAIPGGNIAIVEPSAVNPADPSADVNWGFVELTYTPQGGLYANISYVDFVGLILGMSLLSNDGSTQTAMGLQAGAVSNICSALKAQAAKDGYPWDQLCVTDSSSNQLRVMSPNDFISLNSSAFADYYTNYVDQVWSLYSSKSLTINTQSSAGNVTCKVSGNSTLNCSGDNRGYTKPTAADIFGCNSGPFLLQESDNDVHRAVTPRLCAAFDRSTLLMPGGNFQPALDSSSYYQSGPSNFYSSFVHQYEVDGKGYAFSYDDVNPSGLNEAGVVSSGDPKLLTVTIGGPS
jgi:hypothetical protein